MKHTKRNFTDPAQRPPCDCGNADADWHGDRNGLREYMCAKCWRKKQAARQWRGVFFDGPQSDQNHDGDEIPVWVVYVGDEDAEPIGKVYHLHDFKAAEELAEQISHDRRLELIHEANPD